MKNIIVLRKYHLDELKAERILMEHRSKEIELEQAEKKRIEQAKKIIRENSIFGKLSNKILKEVKKKLR